MCDIKITIPAEEIEPGMRIDRFLSDCDSVMAYSDSMSRSYLQRLIKDNKVLVNSNSIKTSYQLNIGDSIEIMIPKPTMLSIIPEDIPIDIVYEDSDIIIINKPKGMVVHPAPGHLTGTIVNALLFHCKDELSGINGVLRPGIVHRIDMNTTGLIVVCKNDKAHISLSEQLKKHSITREYHAITNNRIKDEHGTIDKPIGRNPHNRKQMAIVQNGRRAVTHYTLLDNLKGNYSYISCKLETGRTHQIRVHFASINHPLYGDDIYGSSFRTPVKVVGQTLHAKKLGFIHPSTHKYIEFDSKLPDYFNKLLNIL